MNKSRFLALSFLVALSGFGVAHAQAPALAAGTYKLAIGSKTTCDVNITAEGAISQADSCDLGVNLTKWTYTGSGYQLKSASGETFAVLKPEGDQLVGVTFANQRKLTLTH